MMWSDDPERDLFRYEREQDRKLTRRPICDICGEHITDEHFYMIDGKKICQECLDDNYLAFVED